jgi:lipid-binding SYLF domain-containing protein
MKSILAGISLALGVLMTGQALAAFTAADVAEVNAEAKTALATFNDDVTGAKVLIENAKGLLICPKITKGGFIIGVESGKCVMEVGGEAVDYYSNKAAKVGLLAGLQQYSMILVFNDQAALDKFREGDRKWEVGADLSVTVAKIGATGKLDTTKMQAAVVALVFGEKGLMGDLSLEGSNFKKLTIEEK